VRFRKREGIWHVRITIGGERYERSTGLADRKAAEARAREIERDLADPERARRAAREATTLQAVVDLASARYARDAASGRRSDDTVAFYKRKWGQVLRVLGPDSRAADVDVAAVTRFVEARRAEGMSEHTIVKEVTALRVALRYARDAGHWRGDLEALVPADLSTDYEPRTRALTVAEVQALIGAMVPKRAAWVAFMLGAGAELRGAERAERGDYDKAGGLVRVRGTKTKDRDRWVPVVLPEMKPLVELAWDCGRGKAPLLLAAWPNNMWRDIHAACTRARIEPVSPHDLRRTFAHWHLAAGLSFEDVARAMGHSSTAMLFKVYGKITPAELRRRMLAGLAPPVPHKGEARSPESQELESPDRNETATNQGFRECRRSELNQRPWDYDSQRRAVVIPLYTPWDGDGRSGRHEARAPRVPHRSGEGQS